MVRQVAANKWIKLLDVYNEIEEDSRWGHLRKPGIRLVQGDGLASAEDARVMLIGEAPGAQENGQGKPFVGASGKMLSQLLGLAGLERSEVFVTNVVKYRPPGNRTPNTREVLVGQESLRKEWSILRPALTICIGATAHLAAHPLGQTAALGRVRYQMHGTPAHKVCSVYHPAFGLRNPKAQPDIERDWEWIGEARP